MKIKNTGTYADLHIHTRIGSKDSTIGMTELFRFALENDYSTVAITDYYGVQGFIEAYEEKEKNQQWDNIKLIFGVELPVLGDNPYAPEYNVTILVKSQHGIKHLYSLLTKVFREKKGTESIPWEWIEKNRDCFLIGSSCNKGEALMSLLNGAPSKAFLNVIRKYDYIELQPVESLINTNNLKARIKDLEENYKELISIASSIDIPVTATSNAHYISKKDLVLLNVLPIDEKANLEGTYLHNKNELYEAFEFLGTELVNKLIENTTHISSMINDNIIPLPKAKYCPKLSKDYKYVEDLCLFEAKKIYGDNLPKEVEDRLNFELKGIREFNTSVHFVTAKILTDMTKADGYTVGFRGMVGSSLVAFLMGITDINPLPPHFICPKCKTIEFVSENEFSIGPDLPDKSCHSCNTAMKKQGFNIPAESFFSIDGSKEPDIDLNFAPEYQQKAIEKISKTFGEDKVAIAGTIQPFSYRSASDIIEGTNISSPEEKEYYISKLSEIKRGLRNHPGGVMVCPEDHSMSEFTPVEYLDKGSIGTTHFDYHLLDTKLVKFDLLTNDSISFLKKLKDATGYNPEDIPLDDKKVISIFSGTRVLNIEDPEYDELAGTYGVPEFDNPTLGEVLIKIKPETLSDLIKINGLFHSTGAWSDNAEYLVSEDNINFNEIVSMREDIMEYLIGKGIARIDAFNIMEKVRRGRPLSDSQVDFLRTNNVPEWYLSSLEKIKYLFPKAHCASYTILSYKIAWYKVYYPKEFFMIATGK